jgi:hypothetical protein
MKKKQKIKAKRQIHYLFAQKANPLFAINSVFHSVSPKPTALLPTYELIFKNLIFLTKRTVNVFLIKIKKTISNS